MDGRTRDAGAVAGLRTTRAPISLARLLMEEGPHVFLSGRGADEFARGAGLEQVANSWFEVPERRGQLHELLTQAASTMRSNTEPSARSRSMSTGMSRSRPRPAD